MGRDFPPGVFEKLFPFYEGEKLDFTHSLRGGDALGAFCTPSAPVLLANPAPLGGSDVFQMSQKESVRSLSEGHIDLFIFDKPPLASPESIEPEREHAAELGELGDEDEAGVQG